MSRGRAAALVVALVAAGCSEGPEGPTPALVADVERLRLVMIEDPAAQVLAEVERVANDRPVFAAQLLRTSGIPAARRQVVAVGRVRLETEEGRRIGARLRAACDARLSALQEYEAVLSGAAADQEALLQALHAQSRADQQLLAVHDELEAITPVEEEDEGEPAAQDAPEVPAPR